MGVGLEEERHSLLEPDIPELDSSSKRRQSRECVREFRDIAEDVVTLENILANEIPKALSEETRILFQSSEVLNKTLEVLH